MPLSAKSILRPGKTQKFTLGRYPRFQRRTWATSETKQTNSLPHQPAVPILFHEIVQAQSLVDSVTLTVFEYCAYTHMFSRARPGKPPNRVIQQVFEQTAVRESFLSLLQNKFTSGVGGKGNRPTARANIRINPSLHIDACMQSHTMHGCLLGVTRGKPLRR